MERHGVKAMVGKVKGTMESDLNGGTRVILRVSWMGSCRDSHLEKAGQAVMLVEGDGSQMRVSLCKMDSISHGMSSALMACEKW